MKRQQGKERKGKERKGKERKGKERKGKERKGKERKGKDNIAKGKKQYKRKEKEYLQLFYTANKCRKVVFVNGLENATMVVRKFFATHKLTEVMGVEIVVEYATMSASCICFLHLL
jgi:hypothetical protein